VKFRKRNSQLCVLITFYLALRECRLLVTDICMISSGKWKVLWHLEVLISPPMDEPVGGWLELAGPVVSICAIVSSKVCFQFLGAFDQCHGVGAHAEAFEVGAWHVKVKTS
jgi:hypothetical protein